MGVEPYAEHVRQAITSWGSNLYLTRRSPDSAPNEYFIFSTCDDCCPYIEIPCDMINHTYPREVRYLVTFGDGYDLLAQGDRGCI